MSSKNHTPSRLTTLFSHSALFLATTLALSSFSASAEQYALIVEDGLVIDGSGTVGKETDIGIYDGKIVAMGDLSADTAVTRIDAKGLVVSPGFIDLHSHAERSVTKLPGLQNLVQQGITTILGGNCGFSPVDIGEYFKDTQGLPLGPNLALLVGHNDIREAVMGSAQRLATEDELEQMKALVDKAMADGAYGFSTGLKYVPGVYSDYNEVKLLSEVAHAHNGFFSSHMRDEGASIEAAMDEVFSVARDTGIPVHISHHKLVGQPNWGQSTKTLAMISDARDHGLDVTLDQYPYTASSTRFAILFPPWALADGQEKIVERLHDPATRAKIKAGIEKNIREDRGGGDADRLQIAHFAAKPEWDGKTFKEVLEMQGKAPTLANAAELTMEIQALGGAQGIFHAIDENDVAAIMAYPLTSVATDTGGVVMGEGNPHPRSYGSYPKVLGQYVREEGVISLPEAIYKMTALPASRMSLTNRGLLKEGYQADIVVFDASTIADNATFTEPHQYATGIRYILINGVVVKDKSGLTGAAAGQQLHHPDSTL